MTHFRSDQHQDPHRTMNSELRNTRPTTVKRGNGATISAADYEAKAQIQLWRRVCEPQDRSTTQMLR
uniref:Uncharacterized protein n=1 Tax=Knipowitschia caucasica TaxID=637954 RepID=A0AAV2KQ37_KNICA